VRRRQAGGFTGGAADEVRAGDQLEGGEADRRDDSTERAGKSRSSDQVTEVRDQTSGSEIGKARRIAMTKKIILLALCSLLLATCSAVEAQQPSKLPKIGFLRARLVASGTSLDGLLRELRTLGYVDGRNVAFEFRSADNSLDRLPALADELVRLKVDLLVAAATVETLAAKNATTTIPIVALSLGTNPVASGLVESLAHPGGNITGFTALGTDLAGKRLELLKETIPKLTRAAVLWNPKEANGPQYWKESQLSARELGLQLHSMQVSSADKFDSAFKEAIKAGSTALSVTQGTFINSYRKQITDLAAKHRLPAMYTREDSVDDGGLMSYGPDQAEAYKRVAIIIDKILKGAKAADLPVEQPTKFELIINLKTAKQIGLTIPPNVLARADKVIK
jgi:putative tryptophan/tyrosine transport system substrate-binding protein